MKSLSIHIALTLALSLVLAGCFNDSPIDASVDAPQDASTDASQNVARTGPRADPYVRFNVHTYIGSRVPADLGANTGTDADANLGTSPADFDAGMDAGADAGSDTGRRGAGRDADSRADINPDAGVETPDLGPPPTPWIFETEELGVLVEADEGTVAEEVAAPAWSTNSIASAYFERPGEGIYSVLVYEDECEARKEVGDSFASDRTVTTANGHAGYVYETNDFGALPDIHAIIQTENFVYYFRSESEEENFEVPEDFLNFIRELELR